MEGSTMKEEQKVSFIHSISAKIMLLTVLAVVMSVLIVAFRAEAGAKKVVGDVECRLYFKHGGDGSGDCEQSSTGGGCRSI